MRVPSNDLGPMTAARVQHVWVDITGHWVDPRPGLLLMWRRRNGQRGGWEAFVVTADQTALAHGGSPRATMGWVDSTHVRPARAVPDPR